jgi:hypothetical protein
MKQRTINPKPVTIVPKARNAEIAANYRGPAEKGPSNPGKAPIPLDVEDDDDVDAWERGCSILEGGMGRVLEVRLQVEEKISHLSVRPETDLHRALVERNFPLTVLNGEPMPVPFTTYSVASRGIPREGEVVHMFNCLTAPQSLKFAYRLGDVCENPPYEGKIRHFFRPKPTLPQTTGWPSYTRSCTKTIRPSPRADTSGRTARGTSPRTPLDV